jgi:hypothetical protein
MTGTAESIFLLVLLAVAAMTYLVWHARRFRS